ncbi:acyl-CoA dehydrogenase [Sphingobium ummariense]
MSYIVDRRGLEFILDECFDLDGLLKAARYAHLDMSTVTAMLDTAQQIAQDRYLPCAAKLDAEEPRFTAGKVEIIPEVAAALKEYSGAGFSGMGIEQIHGGAQLPCLLTTALNGVFMAANISVANYSFLSNGAANLIAACGSDEQRASYLPPMIEGRWFGTMCLSEPQAGSSLSDIRTRADPVGNDVYNLSGSKMWISGGEHELTENIVHMVLAKIPGGPAGAKGISLFIVPKFLPNPDGTPGDFNNIALAGLNHKMGQRGTTNCLLNFGEAGPCAGFLVGQPHEGLQAMFHMMNEARVYVGHTAAMLGLAGYLYSLDYARTRHQGRHPGEKDPTLPQIPIIEHADVRRMLLDQKVAVEGAIALSACCARLVDEKACAQDAAAASDAYLLLELLTPIVKSWPSEHCLDANKQAIQILGGYGYTRDYPVERFYRDNRLNPIHEGALGIHGIDLVGRKIRLEDGRALPLLVAEIERTLAACEELDDEVEAMRGAVAQMTKTAGALVKEPALSKSLASATRFLDAMGTLVVTWLWLKQASVAVRRLRDAREADIPFYTGKIKAARYMVREKLPDAVASLDRISKLDDVFFSMASEEFAPF